MEERFLKIFNFVLKDEEARKALEAFNEKMVEAMFRAFTEGENDMALDIERVGKMIRMVIDANGGV